jgi:hypothetical protein
LIKEDVVLLILGLFVELLKLFWKITPLVDDEVRFKGNPVAGFVDVAVVALRSKIIEVVSEVYRAD